MTRCDYALQALLYSVVLHRFLRWRLPGYDPATHLGGVLYLYLRGMCGPATPVVDGLPCGVFSWRPPGGPRRGAAVRPARRRTSGGDDVSDTFEAVDAHDRDLALGATGVLRDFNTAGVLTAADIHVATTLGRLAGEPDPSVLLAVALAVRAVRHGSVCLDLAAVAESLSDLDLPWPEPGPWTAAVAASPLRAAGVVRLDHDLVYLDRYHGGNARCSTTCASGTVGHHVDVALLDRSLQRVFPTADSDEQRDACRRAATQATTVITGGPGTGKTTAVAGLLAALVEQAEARGDRLRIALAAPTGKAAARLEQSVRGSASRFGEADRARLADVSAMTVHRLLRQHPRQQHPLPAPPRQPAAPRPRRGRRGVDGVPDDDGAPARGRASRGPAGAGGRPRPGRASVNAGAVLTDLVRGYEQRTDSPVAALRTAHRYGREIGGLAEALRLGDADAAIEALVGDGAVEWVREGDPARTIRSAVLPHALAVRDAAAAGDAARALAALDRHRLLCAHRDGPFGVRHWNRRIETWFAAETGEPVHDSAYLGRPLLVAANDYSLGVYNGDTGVVVAVRRPARRHRDGCRLPQAGPLAPRRRRDHARDDHPQVAGRPRPTR